MPKSSMFTRAINTCEMIVGPPAAPSASIGLPSFNTIVGLILDSGRFPGATALASAPTNPK